jgi:hypothetical protein
VGVSSDDLNRSVYVPAGSVQQIVDYLERLRETIGISYLTVPSDQMDEFAQVVDRFLRPIDERTITATTRWGSRAAG